MKNQIKVDIITIGDEILIGQIVDTNSSFIAKELNKIGFSIAHMVSVADRKEEIQLALEESFNKSNLILITGGLGPTKDDITKNVLSDFFEMHLVFDPSVFTDVENIISHRTNAMNDLNRKQAYVPDGCTVIHNKVGTAPAMWFEKHNHIVVSMPGVPQEMKWLMENEILERLKNYYKTPAIIHENIIVCGYPESVLAEKIEDWEDKLPDFISLAYLPNLSFVKLRLSGILAHKQELKEVMSQQIEKLTALLGDAIFAYEDTPMEVLIGRWLKEKNKTLSVAESCTGGNMAHLITSVSGSSDYFCGGVVAYSNQIKQSVLGVPVNLLEKYGAVSQQVVESMAQNVMNLMHTDFGVATSGIAGPFGGTEEKPVGTVWICVCSKDEIKSKCFRFGNIRERNIERATYAAFTMLKEII